MPGDTKIKRVPVGNDYKWIDVDVPSNFYDARWQARDARRGAVAHHARPRTYAVSTPPASPTGLTSLQQRLYDRLTATQGVSASDAHDVITSHGYNAAASYGYMRAAGATNEEALAIIDRGNPQVSLTYGRLREVGHNHAASLATALMHEALSGDD